MAKAKDPQMTDAAMHPRAQTPTSALVVDDHPLFCDALTLTLQSIADFDTVRTAGTLEAAMSARQLSAVMHDGGFTIAAGTAAAHVWADMAERPTAVFTASDECAFGFISECYRLGFRVPRDVSVIGFDDVDFAGHFIPPLTTIHQPRARLGRKAAERLVGALLNGAPLGTGYELIPPHLVVRESTAALPR